MHQSSLLRAPLAPSMLPIRRLGPQVSRVRQGEWLLSIASAYGFEDPNEIYQYAKNADLRCKHQNILYPGDTLVIGPW